MSTDKVYISKLGYKFSICEFAQKADGDVVYFSQMEYDWIKSKKLSSSEFAILWNLKKENFRYDIIPDVEKSSGLLLANKYVPEIIEMIKRTKKASFDV